MSTNEQGVGGLNENKTFTFEELFLKFVSGTPIKRTCWSGYWIYKYGKIEMHLKTGETIDFLETKDVLFTISNLLRNDWEIAKVITTTI